MKTKLTLLALLCSTRLLFASAWDEDGKFKRLYFGFSITPNVTYRYLNRNFVPAGYSSSQVDNVITSRNDHEFPGVGVGGGLRLGVRITHFLAVESGALITYQWYRYRTSNNSLPPGWIPSTQPTDSFISYEMDKYIYLNIPVALNFTIGKHRVKGIISLGTTFDFLLRQRVQYTYEYTNLSVQGGHISQVDNDFRNFNLSPFLGIGMDCYCSKAVVLRIMPQVQMQAFKNIDTPITEYLYNAGINVSLLFGFLGGGK